MAKVKRKENPKIIEKRLADGRISLALEYYIGRVSEPILDKNGNPVLYDSGKMAGTPKYKVRHIRKQETLELYLIAKPRTPIERQQNNATLELADKIRDEKEEVFKRKTGRNVVVLNKNIDMLQFMQDFYDSYNKKGIRNVKSAIDRFKRFLNDTPEYRIFLKKLSPTSLTHEMVEDFTDYLCHTCRGDGAASVYKRFKAIINKAVDEGIFSVSPCKGVRIKSDEDSIKKDILSIEEMQLLEATHYEEQNKEVRRAFLFTLMTGLRFCDIKALVFGNIDYKNSMLRCRQSKTSHEVTIPLNSRMLELIGKPSNNKAEKIFKLPTHPACLKGLKTWCEKAGIDKHITWHCGRHSFATAILTRGADINTTRALLGHQDLRQTQKYLRATDERKREAVNLINLKLTEK